MAGRLLMMAGGSGGHIFPGLALALALRNQGWAVEWLGSQQGLENTLVPKQGIRLHALSMRRLRGKSLLAWLLAPFYILKSILQALRVIRLYQPTLVVGMGGFAAGPGGIAAWLLGKPLLIHDQNAVASLTNRILARFATQIICAFPHAFAKNIHAQCLGNPVRASLLSLAPPEQRFKERSGPLRILVLGGSQGAKLLNQVLPQAIRLLAPASLSVWHQCGKGAKAETLACYQSYCCDSRVDEFIENMDEAYDWADLLVCRAGALTLAELSVVGLASILVPFPYAVDDHQTKNAQFLLEHQAAVLLPQQDLAAESLSRLLQDLINHRSKLLHMAIQARRLGNRQALAAIVACCIEVNRG